MRTTMLALVLPAALGAQTLPLKHAAQPTTAAITANDLMTRLYIFADDSMMGRETGTKGHLMSTEYIARELKRLGVEPAGDNGTYFQNVPLLNRPFDVAASSLTPEGGSALKAGVDFVPSAFRGTPRAFTSAQVIYAGAFGDTSTLPPRDQLKGKAVLLSAGRQTGFGFGGGGAGGAGGFASALADAAIVFRIAGPALSAQTVKAATWPTANMLASFSTGPAVEAPLTVFVTEAAADALLGASVATAKSGTLGRTVSGKIAFAESTAPARNVVGIIRGSDPKLRNTFVAMGAHNDHVGMSQGVAVDHDSLHLYNEARFAVTGMVSRGQRPTEEQRAKVDAIRINLDSVHKAHPARLDSIRNGADDDGSGSVTLLELAESFALDKNKPKRSLLFVFHTGEEKGLLGSRWYSDHTTVPRDSIVAQLNMDMVGRGEARDLPVGGPNYLQLVGSKRLSSELGAIVEKVNAGEKQPFVFDYQFDAAGHPENIYCRSDHANYARYGIPVTFFTTGLHGDYHQVTDEPQYINYEHMARIGQFVRDVATTVANLDHRPVVDGQRLDPNGRCQQ